MPHTSDIKASRRSSRARRAYRAFGASPDRLLRVVYLDHVARLSGGELALLRLLPALDRVDAHVILAEHGPLVDELRAAGIGVEVLPISDRVHAVRKDDVRPGRVPATAVWGTILYIAQLTRRLRTLAPDLVHTNSLKAGLYGSVAAALARVPMVWHVRDRLTTDYLPLPALLLVRLVAALVPRLVITNSEATQTTLATHRRSVVIGSPVAIAELDAIASARSQADDVPVVLTMLGRVAPWKGQDVFLRAFARAFPESDARARIVGAPLFGEEEETYARDLRALATTLGIADRVDFRGHRTDVGAELAVSTALVHASVVPEPFGQVVVEGMAAGLTVVACQGGGPGAIISDGVDGLLYPPGDVESLAQLMRRVGAEPTLRRVLGDAARRRARDFSPAAIAEQTMQAYARALNVPRRELPTDDG